jgi:hypothetical protein
MSEVVLDGSCVLSVVCELVAGGVAQHVRVNLELEPSLPPGTADDFAGRVGRKRGLALADEDVGRIGVIALQPPEGAQFCPAHGMDRVDSALAPGDMQEGTPHETEIYVVRRETGKE